MQSLFASWGGFRKIAGITERKPHDRCRSRRRRTPGLGPEPLEARALLTVPELPWWDENETAEPPTQVSGAFLTGGALQRPGESEMMSFDEVVQGFSDTCSFSAVLSAVARTRFNLESGIVMAQKFGETDYLYKVRLYKRDAQGTYQPEWIDVRFDGKPTLEDLKTSDRKEFWSALYLRAFLALEARLGENYQDARNGFRALTGQTEDTWAPQGDARAQAKLIEAALVAGRPMVAGTEASGVRLLDGGAGIISQHAYTVLGVEVPESGSSGIYVTLRNPWGVDTDPGYFDTDQDGHLSLAERERFGSGLDGGNDGIVRVPWAKFAMYFDHVVASHLTGASINAPKSAPPVYLRASIGTLVVHQGEMLGPIDASAVHPDGMLLDYSLKLGSPGYVNQLSGQYTWEPGPDQEGIYAVTVVASADSYTSATLTFFVYVQDGAPRIDSLVADRETITDSSTDLLTLTARGVTTPVGSIAGVGFWRDFDGDGALDPARDVFIGSGVAEGNDWSWTGYVGSVQPGPQTFFAQASRFSYSALHLSNAVSRTLTVKAAPAVKPVAIPVGDQVQASEATYGRHTALGLETDGQGNVRAFWRMRSYDPTAGIFRMLTYTRKYDAAGRPLTGAQILPISSIDYENEAMDVAMRPDGSFVLVWTQASNLYAQWYTADGVASSAWYPVSHDAWARNPYVQAAVDRDGNLLVAYNRGEYFSEDIYAASLSPAGDVTRAPWQVNTQAISMQKFPTVALNGDGTGVIAWADYYYFENAIMARTVTNAGRANGAEVTVYRGTDLSTDSPVSSAVNGAGDFVVAWITPRSPSVPVAGPTARRYDRDGRPKGAPFRVATPRASGQWLPTIAMNDAGYSVYTWLSYGQDIGDTPNETGTYGRIFDPQGIPFGPEFAVPTALAGSQVPAGLAIDADADITVAWIQGAPWELTGQPSSLHLRQFRVNVAPQLPARVSFSVAEKVAVGTLVGTVAAVDPDGDGLTYALVGESPFAIDPRTGRITVAGVLDYERSARYELLVRAIDDGVPARRTPSTVTVLVRDVNEAPVVRSSTFTVPEMSEAGTIVGRVRATDPDAGDRLTYAMVDAGPFAIDAETGVIAVQDRAALDYEAGNTYNIKVRVTDRKNLSRQVTVTVLLTDVNELSVLRADHGFHSAGTDRDDSLGRREKWFQDREGRWHILTPDGRLRRWSGTFPTSPVIATVAKGVYNNLDLLFHAPVSLSTGAWEQLSRLRRDYGFVAASTREGSAGHLEKWLKDRQGRRYILTPDGVLRRWSGKFETSPVVAAVERPVYDDPVLLINAPIS